MMFRPLAALILLIPSLSVLTAAQADSKPQVDQLMAFFGSQCHSRGQFSDSATKQAQAFRDLLKSFGQDPKCKPVGLKLEEQLNSIEGELSLLQANDTAYTIRALKHRREELEAMLMANPAYNVSTLNDTGGSGFSRQFQGVSGTSSRDTTINGTSGGTDSGTTGNTTNGTSSSPATGATHTTGNGTTAATKSGTSTSTGQTAEKTGTTNDTNTDTNKHNIDWTRATHDSKEEFQASEVRNIQSELVQVINDLSRAESVQSSQDEIQQRKAFSATKRLLQGTDLLFDEARAQQDCLVKHPNVLASLGNLAGAVFASVAPPATSLAVSGGMSFLNQILTHNTVRRVFTSRIDENLKAEAYSCVAEAFTDQWCSYEETKNLIKQQMELVERVASGNPNALPAKTEFSEALELLRYELNPMIKWLNRVHAGTEPSSIPIAEEQKQVDILDKAVELIGLKGVPGVLNGLKDSLTGKLPPEQWPIIKSIINEIKKQIDSVSYSGGGSSGGSSGGGYGSNSNSGPFYSIINSRQALFYLLGIEKLVRLNSSSAGSLETYPEFSDFDPFNPRSYRDEFAAKAGDIFQQNFTVAGIKDRFDTWYLQTKKLVSDRKNDLMNSDPISVLGEAYTQTEGAPSPLRSLIKFEEFFKNYPPKSGDKLEYNSTLRRITRVIQILRSYEGGKVFAFNCTAPAKIQDKEKFEALCTLSAIKSAASLKEGSVEIQNRIERSLRLRMTEFMHTQKSDPYAQLKAIDDVIVEIKKYSTNQDKTLPDLLHDLEAAQNTALTSLDNFLNIRDYEKGFVRAIQHYKKHSYARAKVCYNLLGVREWDKPFYKKVLKLCSGESLNDYPTGPKTDVLNATVFELPQEKRACIFRNYRRDNLVFEKLSGTAKDIKR